MSDADEPILQQVLNEAANRGLLDAAHTFTGKGL
jgi:hypothetical protein